MKFYKRIFFFVATFLIVNGVGLHAALRNGDQEEPICCGCFPWSSEKPKNSNLVIQVISPSNEVKIISPSRCTRSISTAGSVSSSSELSGNSNKESLVGYDVQTPLKLTPTSNGKREQEELLNIIKTKQDLRALDISFCKKIDLRTLTMIGRLHELEHLNISGIDSLDDDTLIQILTGCLHLKYLDVSGLRMVSARGFGLISMKFFLKQLCISCTQIQTKALRLILSQCNGLHYVDIRNCSKLDLKEVQSIVQEYPHVKIRTELPAQRRSCYSTQSLPSIPERE